MSESRVYRGRTSLARGVHVYWEQREKTRIKHSTVRRAHLLPISRAPGGESNQETSVEVHIHSLYIAPHVVLKERKAEPVQGVKMSP